MAGSLSPAQILFFSEHGFLSPLSAIKKNEARALLEELRDTETNFSSFACAIMNNTSSIPPALQRVMRDARVLDTIESLIGPDIIVCGAQLFVKEPRTKNFVSWHQDGFYWGSMSASVVTAWIALSASGSANGCVRVLPGSHNSLLPHSETFAPDNMLSHGQAVDVEKLPNEVVQLVLEPGEMSLHHSLTLHGSEPNLASYPRIGFAIRYAASHLYQRPDDGSEAVLVRGKLRAQT